MVRQINHRGHLLYDDTTEAELYMWNTDTKSRLALQVVARESGLPVEELAKRVARLRQLLPDLSDGAVKGMKPATLARLARNVDDIAERVLMLKAAMPEVNVSKVACGYPPVLSMAPAEVSDRWTRVRELLSGASDHGLLRILHECPDVLDTDMLEGAMAELGTMMGDAAIPALESNPRLLYAAEPLDHIRNDFEDVAAALWTPPGGSAEEAVAEAAGEE
ncbi:unnamed protein product [Pedinophyceae sp. YPF-701]|nr:unnamed protein product [Pedinophyceae sp. YPF-701]